MNKFKRYRGIVKSGWLYAGLFIFMVVLKSMNSDFMISLDKVNYQLLNWVAEIVGDRSIKDSSTKNSSIKGSSAKDNLVKDDSVNGSVLRLQPAEQKLAIINAEFDSDNFVKLAMLLKQYPDAQIVISAKPNKKIQQQLHYFLQLYPRDKQIIWSYANHTSSLPIKLIENQSFVESVLFELTQFRFKSIDNIQWRTSESFIYSPVVFSNNQNTQLIWQNEGELYLNYIAEIIKQNSSNISYLMNFFNSQLITDTKTTHLGFANQLTQFKPKLKSFDLDEFLLVTSNQPNIILIADQELAQSALVAKQIEAWLQNDWYYKGWLVELCFYLLVLVSIVVCFYSEKTKLTQRLLLLTTFILFALMLQTIFYYQQQWLVITPILVLTFLLSFLLHFYNKEQRLLMAGSADSASTKNAINEIVDQTEPVEEINKHDKRELELQDVEESLERTLLITDNKASTSTITQAIYKIENFGRYKVEGILGKGAMGIVYQGVDPKINRHVAVKTLQLSNNKNDDLSAAKLRFFKEAETAGNLSHANIVTIYDVGEEADLGYIAMDLLTGAPLSKFSKPNNILPTALIYQLMIQITDALDYAHKQHVVHRDIKPGNIIFDDDSQRVTVTDFGIAYVADNSKTSTGTIMGSPYYMSPEQILGQQVDGRSDIFSLGVTFYQLLSGYLPFEGDSIASVAYQISHAKQASIKKWNPNLPSSATRITNKAMHKDIEKRYQTMAEFKQALINALKRDFKKTPLI